MENFLGPLKLYFVFESPWKLLKICLCEVVRVMSNPLFTLGSIYSTNASRAEQTPETNHLNQLKDRSLFIAFAGRRIWS